MEHNRHSVVGKYEYEYFIFPISNLKRKKNFKWYELFHIKYQNIKISYMIIWIKIKSIIILKKIQTFVFSTTNQTRK